VRNKAVLWKKLNHYDLKISFIIFSSCDPESNSIFLRTNITCQNMCNYTYFNGYLERLNIKQKRAYNNTNTIGKQSLHKSYYNMSRSDLELHTKFTSISRSLYIF